MTDRFKLIASVYLVPLRDGKVLLSRRFQTGYEDGKYGLVAGHVEGDETFREALAREVREEVGIELDLSGVNLALTMHRWCGDHERVDFFFTADHWIGEIQNKEPEKCDDLGWFPINDLPENLIAYIEEAIRHIRHGQPYAEFGWER